MATSSSTSPTAPALREPLRLRLWYSAAQSTADGAWWPQSRDLQTEVADLIDHFPKAAGRINRLLFSRPDWDNPTLDGRGVRRIRTARGPVKVGSFPHDDTRLMIATMASAQRLKLLVIPSATGHAEAERRLRLALGTDPTDDSGASWTHADNESPGT